MSNFGLWFVTGIEHILDLNGYDHLLYVSLLALAFSPAEWKKLLILVTGFTAGHSCSLALSVTGNWQLPQDIIEALISLSIFLTACYQLYINARTGATRPPSSNDRRYNRVLYVSTVVFGLIHGLGFSFLLRAMLGAANAVFLPLLYFNLGLEVGQVIIVCVILLFSLFLKLILKWPFPVFKKIIVCVIALIAFFLSAQRFLQLF